MILSGHCSAANRCEGSRVSAASAHSLVDASHLNRFPTAGEVVVPGSDGGGHTAPRAFQEEPESRLCF